MAIRTLFALGTAVITAGCGLATGPEIASPSAGAEFRGTRAGRAAVETAGFRDLEGRPVGLAQFTGRPIVLAFLSPSDRDSQAQVPHLIRLAGAYQPEGVVFLMAGEDATANELREFARQLDLPFPVWQDPGAAEHHARGFTALPAHQFVNRAGKVVVSRQGFMARGELLEAIAAIL